MGLAREPRILYWSLLAGCAHLLIKHILRWWTSERRLEFASNRFIQGPLHTVIAAHGRTTHIGGGRDSCGSALVVTDYLEPQHCVINVFHCIPANSRLSAKHVIVGYRQQPSQVTTSCLNLYSHFSWSI